ncbi:MAG: Rne/Rng family ribonuclease [Bacillota bacterium]|nr:Rne/Rng family ribonuclease [Bacillota bacterium]MDD3297845.1 Rne/Rng family ribonuclease [Bacillota bacterium]MDD3851051.1 Rne/Rng family ribonuclease [Bacillota bacterium]MDD4706968.1 Rne/Rng family ribonuclease [Bacillota bacterium]
MNEIIVDVSFEQTRVALLENEDLNEVYIERFGSKRNVGSIYKGRVENVLPGMQAAFVNIGLEKNAFLYVKDAFVGYEDEYPDLGRNEDVSIKDLLKKGQELTVQVIKEPLDGKGARVTTNITLPGRFMVLLPNANYVGISRRIESEEERNRLREIAHEIKPDNMGLIIRTASEEKDLQDFRYDLKVLLKLWGAIKKKGRTYNAPRIIHRDLNLVMRTVRDMFTRSIDRFVINSRSEYEKVLELLDIISPQLKERVVLFDKEYNIFDYYGVEPKIANALSRKVWLKSGGYIVIDKTEALTAIDVNTGKFVGSLDLKDTVFKTNLEATREIARQLRLRDIGGIIIVDFIDMDNGRDGKRVLEELKKHLKRDRTRSNVLGMTQLGLVEITRKKVGRRIDSILQKECPFCEGTGRVLSEETMVNRIERELKRVFSGSEAEAALIEAHPSVAALVIGSGGEHLARLEKQFQRHIYIKGSFHLHPEEIEVKVTGNKEYVERCALPVRDGEILDLIISETYTANNKDGIGKMDGYVINVERAGKMVGKKVKVKIVKAYKTYAKGKLV